jgi:hypothetical protein
LSLLPPLKEVVLEQRVLHGYKEGYSLYELNTPSTNAAKVPEIKQPELKQNK